MTHGPTPDEFGALLEELEAITRRLTEIDGRIAALGRQRVETLQRTLSDLERRVATQPAATMPFPFPPAAPPPHPVPTPVQFPSPQAVPVPQPAPVPRPVPAPQPGPVPQQAPAPRPIPGSAPTLRLPAPPRPPVWERPQFLARLLAVVGAGVTLIGIAFLLALAAQYGFFGPLARTLAAAGLGVVLLGIAFWVHGRSPDNPGAPALAATGVASGFLSVVAATVIYSWLPPLVGLALVAAIGLAGLTLARLWDNEVLAVVAVLASLVLAPFIGSAEPVVTAALMVALSGVTQWFEGRRGWRVLPLARVLPTVGMLVYVVTGPGATLDDVERLVVVGLALVFVGLALVSILTAPREPGGLLATRLGLAVAAALPAVLAPALLDSVVLQALAFWVVAVAFTVAGALPFVRSGARATLLPLGALFVFLTVFAITDQRYVGAIAMGLAIAYLAAGVGARSWVSWSIGVILGAAAVLMWFPQVSHVLGQASASTATAEDAFRSLLGIPLGVLLHLGVSRFFRERTVSLYGAWAISLGMGSVGVVELASLVGVLLRNPAAGFQAGQFLVTSSWMLLCVLLLRFGLASSRERAGVWLALALVLAGLALVKLFLLDLSMLDAIARVGAFLVVGLLLLFVGTRYAKAWERARAADPVPDAAAVGPSGDGPTGAPLGGPPAR